MKILLLTLVAVATTYAAPGSLKWLPLQDAFQMNQEPLQATGGADAELESKWNDFKIKHNKNYANREEEQKRKAIFTGHLKVIADHNALHAQGKKSYRLGINEYADMDHKEFVTVMNGYKMRDPSTLTYDRASYMSPLASVNLPEEVDWREKGYVTPVKNQGQCGSCWAFSTTGSLEGQHFRRDGKLVSLSEQNLVDCSKAWGNNGCNGGLMDNAFQYIKDNDGIDTEKSYPYRAEDERCHFKSKNIGATDIGFVDVVPHGNEKKLKEAVGTVGPVSIAIDASHQSFQLYESGVYDEPECSSEQLDHGVLIVGYGTEDDGDYWIVKNSWGPSWGMHGYVKMSRNKDNQCGVATSASYPLV